MTISNETYRHDYSGNGTTVLFTISFYFLKDAHIKAILYNTVTEVETELTLTTHYTLTGAGDLNGGELTMVTAPTSDETLTILRDVDVKQETDYVEGGAFPADDHEEALDKLTMIVQELKEKIDRSLKSADSQQGSWTLPAPIAEYFLRWNEAGLDLENYDIVSLEAYAVTAFVKTLLDDLSASAFLTTLGLDTDLLTLDLPASTVISAFVKTLLDDADASAFLTTLDFSAFVKTLLDDADASAFLTTLGFSAFVKTLLDDTNTSAFLTTLGFSTFVKTLLNDADASAFLTTLGLDTDLRTLNLPVNTTISTFIKTLLNDADAATARATLGVPANNSITQAKMADSAIGQAELKSTTQTQSYDIALDSAHKFVLTGGEYCFRPTAKAEDISIIMWGTTSYVPGALTTSYATVVVLMNLSGSAPKFGYVIHRYVQASGEVYWIFILRDKITKKNIGISACADHPCFGQGGKPNLMPHPFLDDFDEAIHEIIVINPTKEQVLEMQKKCLVESEDLPDRDLTEVIEQEYAVDDTIEPDWPDIPVTVKLPDDWEDAWLSKTKVTPIKKIIPRPDYIRTAALKLKV